MGKWRTEGTIVTENVQRIGKKRKMTFHRENSNQQMRTVVNAEVYVEVELAGDPAIRGVMINGKRTKSPRRKEGDMMN